MKKLFLILLCLISVTGNALTAGSSSSSKHFADIDKVVHQALDDFEIPGAAIAVVINGEIVFAKGYGYRDLEKKLPVTTKTLFAIGSCSKAFTTFVLATMVDEGLIAWDDPVIKHLPEFGLKYSSATENVTIQDLATHRTGLPRHDYIWYDHQLTRKEILERVKYLDLTCSPREKFQYNNLMYAVLGLVIENVTGKTWEETVQERIFNPLQMNDSNFSVDDSKQSPDVSLPYATTKERLHKIPFRNIDSIGPAGSINSNLDDMSKWLQLQLSDEVGLITNWRLKEMQTIQIPIKKDSRQKTNGYGLGWFIESYHGHDLIQHSGNIDGFVANVSFFPREKMGIIVLCNHDDGYNFVTSVRLSLYDSLLNLSQVGMVKNTNPLKIRKVK